MKKRILFVGDLETSRNWGARGTSYSFNKMLKTGFPDAEISRIEFRSLYFQTPIEGWSKKDPYQYSSLKWHLKRILIRFSLYSYVRRSFGKKSSKELREGPDDDFLPSTFEEFESCSYSILKDVRYQHEIKKIKDSDFLVISAEGNFVNHKDHYRRYRRAARYLFFIAYVAKKRFNKPVYIMNHTVDPRFDVAENIIKNLYPIMDGISVREPLSIETLNRINPDIKPMMHPDALFTFELPSDYKPSRITKSQVDFSRPFIALGDSSSLPEVSWDIEAFYDSLIPKLKTLGFQIVLIDGGSTISPVLGKLARKHNIGWFDVWYADFDELYYVLSRSLVYISGRWHPSILASKAGVPLVLWGADSHKTQGLIQLLDYPIEYFETKILPSCVDNIFKATKDCIDDRSAIEKHFKIKSFELANLSKNMITEIVSS